MKPKFIAILALVLLAFGLVFWKVHNDRQNQKPAVFVPKKNQAQPADSLGAQVYEKQTNPVKDQIPQTNPFKDAKTNPIDQSYKNPFE